MAIENPERGWFTAPALPNSGSWGRAKQLWNQIIEAVLDAPPVAAITDVTIASGLATVTRGSVALASEAGTADQLDKLSIDLPEGRMVQISAQDTHTITVAHGASGDGGIDLVEGANVVLSGAGNVLTLKRVGTRWQEVRTADNVAPSRLFYRNSSGETVGVELGTNLGVTGSVLNASVGAGLDYPDWAKTGEDFNEGISEPTGTLILTTAAIAALSPEDLEEAEGWLILEDPTIVVEPTTFGVYYLGGNEANTTTSTLTAADLPTVGDDVVLPSGVEIEVGDTIVVCGGTSRSTVGALSGLSGSAPITLGSFTLRESLSESGDNRAAGVSIATAVVTAVSGTGEWDLTANFAVNYWQGAIDVYLVKGGITVVGTINAAKSTTTLTLDIAATAVADDVLISAVATADAGAGISPPSGFDYVADQRSVGSGDVLSFRTAHRSDAPDASYAWTVPYAASPESAGVGVSILIRAAA